MSKQDRQGVRTAQDLERKYDFSLLGKGGNQDLRISQLMQSLAQFEKKFTNIESKLDNLHPVGSIYISANDIEPSTLFGGSWQLVGKGHLVVARESEEPQIEYLENCNVWKRVADGNIAILDEAILDFTILA